MICSHNFLLDNHFKIFTFPSYYFRSDKSSANYVFICKKFYLLSLFKELGIINNLEFSGNNTYSPFDMSLSIIIQHRTIINASFNISIAQNGLCLLKFYAIPKLHNFPYKFRFITSALLCVNFLRIYTAFFNTSEDTSSTTAPFFKVFPTVISFSVCRTPISLLTLFLVFKDVSFVFSSFCALFSSPHIWFIKIFGRFMFK